MALTGCAAAFAPLSALARDLPGEAARLRDLLEQSETAAMRLDPLAAVRKGSETANSGPAFVDPLADVYWTTLRADKTREWNALQTIDRTLLPLVDQIAYDVFAYQLQLSLALFEDDLFEIQRLTPFNPSFGLHVEFPDFVSGGAASFKSPADYQRNLERLDGFADYLLNAANLAEQGLAKGYKQPRIVIEAVLKQVDAMLATPATDSPFWSAIKRMPESFSAADKARLTEECRSRITDKIYPGYRRWQSLLRDTYLPVANAEPGRWAMKDGERLYGWELRGHTTTTLPPQAIHDLGLSEVARIRANMEKVRAKVGFAGDLPAFFEHIRTDPKFYYKTPEELLARFEAIEAKIWPGIPKLFHNSPSAPFEVRPLPALGDQRGTGYYSAGPPDGKSPGILFFNMSMLNTRPIPTLETLTLHEGIPGH
ncbi:MAG: DUF885 domain-containing protein, partial [Burkholderiales bacterium]